MSNKESDLEFIKLVESYPILYAKEHTRGHKNSNMKNDVWREIAQVLKKSEVACITRWKSIRDRFGKEFRRQQQNPSEVTNWELFPHLWFLKDHYKQGCASNSEAMECLKYQPKVKKRKVVRSEDEDENSDVKISPEELTLNQNIIALVKEHDVLYDRKRVRDSKNLTAKNEAWTNIASALGISEETCYMKWKKLRDRFSREYRQIQLNPEKPITWIYFNDLRFLESHYRKGIPLPIEEIKRKEKSSATTVASHQVVDNPWGDDFSRSYYSDNDDQHDHELITEETDIQELQEQTFDEFLFLPNKKICIGSTKPNGQALQQVTYHVAQEMTPTTTYVSATPTAPCTSTTLTTTEINAQFDPEDKLNCVITNMECVLRQSQDCLKALQTQKAQHRNELQQHNLSMQPEMLQKVQILLDGLHPDQKMKAERKILQFLCECQIKILNNEEVADVSPVNIY